MPRQARLDIPGLLQHVIVRGIERSDIFLDDDDRQRFVDRFDSLLVETGADCFAWALIPNHAMDDNDARVLGGGDFVASLREEPRFDGKLSRTMDMNSLQARVSNYFKLPSAAILRRGRRNQYSEARELFCYLAVRELGYSGSKVGAMIGMGTPSVSRALRRGEELVASRPELKEWWVTQLKQ
jgi:hypothetical protein